MRGGELNICACSELRCMDSLHAWGNTPPSDGQAKFAKRLGINVDGMTKGQVANAITRKLALQAIKRAGVAV